MEDPQGQLESDRLQMARQWLQANQPDRALDTVNRALNEALETTDPAQQGRAWFEVGWVHAWTGQFDEAEHAFRQAVVALPGGDDESSMAPMRMRFLRDHGLLIAQMGRLEEARAIFGRAQIAAACLSPSEAIRQRALLVLPLAQALLATGEVNEAAKRLELALDGLAGAGDQNSLLQALILLAETRATLGEEPLLPNHPPENCDISKLAEALASHVSDLAQTDSDADPVMLRRLLRWFVNWLETTQGEKSRLLGDALGLLANIEGNLGDGPARVAAIDRAERCYRGRNEIGYAIQALQGKGLALAQMGDTIGAESAYRAGLAEARSSGSAFLVSQLSRNLGQFLAEVRRLEEAETLLPKPPSRPTPNSPENQPQPSAFFLSTQAGPTNPANSSTKPWQCSIPKNPTTKPQANTSTASTKTKPAPASTPPGKPVRCMPGCCASSCLATWCATCRSGWLMASWRPGLIWCANSHRTRSSGCQGFRRPPWNG